MPCITAKSLTAQQRERMQAAIARLDAALASGAASVVVSGSGAVAFKGWQDREGVTDICAYRKLAAENSPALRRAVMRAEALAGRRVDERAVTMGVHSHDGGQNWGSH